MAIGEVETFAEVAPDKAQALKPLEEAAEVFGAWQRGRLHGEWVEGVTAYRVELLDECADVVQAVCNLAAALGEGDLTPWMERCRERNAERGRC